MAQDPYRYFRPEARNLLDQFAQGILELEKNGGGAGAVQRLLRLAHTLKGAARVVRQSAIAERAHAIEDALAPFREGTDGMARENIDAILAHLDEISSRIVTLVPGDGFEPPAQQNVPAAPATNSSVATPKASATDGVRETSRVIRAEMADVDALLDGVAEIHARLIGLRRSAEAIEQINYLTDLLRAQTASYGPAERSRGSSASIGSTTQGVVEELRRKIGGLAQELDAATAQMDRELRQLRDAAESMRLVPVDTVLMALKRTARDTARTLGKEVNVECTGGDIRLDGDVLGAIQGALIQLVRNAVAHGFEPENERRATGKPSAGQITVEVSRRGPKILFQCRDDGRGIDVAAVRAVAAERGLLNASVGDLGAEDLLRVLLHGGVSTSASPTFRAAAWGSTWCARRSSAWTAKSPSGSIRAAAPRSRC
jgi:two-component system chemotaxis sensor kinase CheA